MDNPCKDCKIKKTIYIDENGLKGFIECQSCPTQKELIKYVDECFARIDKILNKDKNITKKPKLVLGKRVSGKHKEGCNWCSIEGCTCGHFKEFNCSWFEFINRYGWLQALKVFSLRRYIT